MDSSSVYGAARKLQKQKLLCFATSQQEKDFQAFSIAYPGSPIDETPWMKRCLEFWDDRQRASVVTSTPELFPQMIEETREWHDKACEELQQIRKQIENLIARHNEIFALSTTEPL